MIKINRGQSRHPCDQRCGFSSTSARLSWSRRRRPASQLAGERGRWRRSASNAKPDQPAFLQVLGTQAGPPDPHQTAFSAFTLLPGPLPQVPASGLSLPQPEGALLHPASKPDSAPGSKLPPLVPPVQYTGCSTAAASPSTCASSLHSLLPHSEPHTCWTLSWVQSGRHPPLPAWYPVHDADSSPQRSLSGLRRPTPSPASTPPPDAWPHVAARELAAPSHPAAPAHADLRPSSTSSPARPDLPAAAAALRQHPAVPHPPSAAAPTSPQPFRHCPDAAPPLSEPGGLSAGTTSPWCCRQPISATLLVPPAPSADRTASPSPTSPPTDSRSGSGRRLADAYGDSWSPRVLGTLPQFRLPEHRVALTAPRAPENSA